MNIPLFLTAACVQWRLLTCFLVWQNLFIPGFMLLAHFQHHERLQSYREKLYFSVLNASWSLCSTFFFKVYIPWNKVWGNMLESLHMSFHLVCLCPRPDFFLLTLSPELLKLSLPNWFGGVSSWSRLLCRNFVYYLQDQDHRVGFYNQNMTVSTGSSKMLILLQPSFSWW